MVVPITLAAGEGGLEGKGVTEQLHPETKHGATGGSNKGKTRSKVANLASSVPRYTADATGA
jgi:hypothetical protein